MWVFSFIVASCHFVLASATAIWYFDSKKNALSPSVYRLFRYHFGSIAFGALILTLINIL